MSRLMLVIAACLGYSASFVSLPMVSSPTDSTARISFSVTDTTNVTIWIAGTGADSGKVLRHLVSGRLGKKPPAPLLANSLSQSIDWDLRDDDGNRVSGTYEVMVGVDVQPKFGRIYGCQNQNLLGYYNTVAGLAVDGEGNLIVLASQMALRTGIFVFSRSGQYVRTLLPYPGDLTEDKVKGYGRIRLNDGSRIPVVYQGHSGVVMPEIAMSIRQGMAVAPQGWLVMANEARSWNYGGVNEWGGSMVKERRALIIGLDGSCPKDTVYGPIFATGPIAGPLFMAVSPDGRKIYSAGLKQGKFDHEIDVQTSINAVYRADINSSGQADTFLGKPYLRGNDTAHFYSPHGLALDTTGNLYVADYGNNRVMIYDSNGAYLNKILIANPDQLHINRKTGDLYVVSIDMNASVMTITKYSGYPALAQQAVYTEAYYTPGGSVSFQNSPITALDPNAVPVRLWISPFRPVMDGVIRCLEDTGAGFAFGQVTVGGMPPVDALPYTLGYAPGRITINKNETELVCGAGGFFAHINLQNGAISHFANSSNSMLYGPDGCLYGYPEGPSYTDGSIRRYSTDGVTPVNFAGGTTNRINQIAQDFAGWANPWGWTIDKKGNFCTVECTSRYGHMTVTRFDSAGQNKKTIFMVQNDEAQINSGGATPLYGVGFDPAGNLFLSANLRPFGVFYPKDFAKSQSFLPNPYTYTWQWPYAAVNYYAYMQGCVFKLPANQPIRFVVRPTFDPASIPHGTLDADTVPLAQVDGTCEYSYDITGGRPDWQYFGASPVTGKEILGDPGCICQKSSFDVDNFGRVMVTDAFRFSVEMLDNNGNEMVRIGRYGNPDNGGPQSARPTPEIPVGFLRFVKSTDRAVYISDEANIRILRADLKYSVLWSSARGVVDSIGVETGRLADGAGLSVSIYPEPVRSHAVVMISTPKSGVVSARIYTLQGRLVSRVAEGARPSGKFRLTFDARDAKGRLLSPGVYLLKVKAEGDQIARRFVITD